MSNTASKNDVGKVRFDLLPPAEIWEVARCFTYGADKYDPSPTVVNYRKGHRWGQLFAATMRHLWLWWRGEEFDEESGIHHLTHAATNCLMLAYQRKENKGTDDRPFSNTPF